MRKNVDNEQFCSQSYSRFFAMPLSESYLMLGESTNCDSPKVGLMQGVWGEVLPRDKKSARRVQFSQVGEVAEMIKDEMK